ncbi:MAG: immunoglobulin domain-containing protein, partial [Candidatus Omnitrophica bacterium]|nr:immunoglobulin domain-containing protein [Candidatus Omnitrophota bacterium]
MKTITKTIARFCIFIVAGLLGTSASAPAASVLATFPAQDRASGVSWDLNWSNPNQTAASDPQMIMAGVRVMDPFTGNQDTSAQLRFDVTALNGVYTAINSVTLRLTQQANFWNGQQAGTLELYRLTEANAGWTSSATWGYLDGSAQWWAGGPTGATTPDVDYVSDLLASAPYDLSANSEGTVYDLVISGAKAEALIQQWASGGLNEGFLLRANGSELGDNRILFYSDGPQGPRLIVDFTPKSGLPVTFTQQPASAFVAEAASVAFSVSATGVPPLTYQWLRNGTPIDNATNSLYRINAVQVTDNNAKFSVKVTDAVGTANTSSEALLVVVADTQPPTLVSASSLNPTTVRVLFSEPVTPATATATNNYTISGGATVLAADLGVDQTTVTLTTSTRSYGDYTLTVSGVADTSAAANLIAPNSRITFKQTPKVAFPAVARASGVDWNKAYSNPNQESHLAIGKWYGLTSTQLRFDLSALNGVYDSINSVTLRLTVGYYPDQPHWWTQWLNSAGVAGVAELYRLTPANAAWNSNGTFGTMDGTNPWAGGDAGALIPEADYDTNLLASVAYSNAPLGTVYDLVIPAELAKSIIDQWSSGGVNEGFVLLAQPTSSADNRGIFIPDGPNAPQLIVDYTPRSGGSLTVTQSPASAAIAEASSATFTVAASGAPPLQYQWLRNGNPIPDATNSQYTLEAVKVTDSDARFSVKVTDELGSSLITAEALLTVIPDTQPPTIAAVTGIDNLSLEAKSSEPVTPESAAVAANYSLSGQLEIRSVQMGVDPTEVILFTSPQTLQASYTLTVSGIHDTSNAQNIIADNSQASFVTPTPRAVLAMKDRASGVDWDDDWSNPNQTTSSDPLHLAAGRWIGQTSSQVRFDVTPLSGLYTAINSVTIRLTQQVNYWNGKVGGVLE